MKVINRGGEIVSPLEVEEVVLAHPAAIAECVAFALLHALLGEAVTVCVVSRRPAVRHDADGGDEARAARASHRTSTRSARTARSRRRRHCRRHLRRSSPPRGSSIQTASSPPLSSTIRRHRLRRLSSSFVIVVIVVRRGRRALRWRRRGRGRGICLGCLRAAASAGRERGALCRCHRQPPSATARWSRRRRRRRRRVIRHANGRRG